MPTIHTEKGFDFRFYASDMGEPPHVHAVKGNKKAKIWLQEMTFAYNRGFNQSEVGDILKITQQQRQMFLEAWNAFFN